MADLFSDLPLRQFDSDHPFQTLDSLLFAARREFHLYHSHPESTVSGSSLFHARISVRGEGPASSSGTLCCMDERVSEPGSVSGIDPLDRENQVNFVMDLFQQRVEQSQVMWGPRSVSEAFNSSSFAVGEDNSDVVTRGGLGLNLGLSLGLGCESNNPCLDADCEMIVENCGVYSDDDDDDDYYDFSFGRRVSGSLTGETPSTASVCELFVNHDIIVGTESDSDEDVNEIVSGTDLHSENEFSLHFHGSNDDETSTPLCWDSLNLEENHMNTNEDFEWEEVDGRFDERELLSAFAELEDEEHPPVLIPDDEMDSLAWQVLFLNNLQGNPEAGQETELDFAEYDVGQFSMNEMIPTIRPPASRTVVQSLQSLVLTEEDLEKNDTICPICMDGIKVGEEAKQLPCCHRYHGECITPWLGIGNTCPVCRYELPTDDAEYERRKRQIRQ